MMGKRLFFPRSGSLFPPRPGRAARSGVRTAEISRKDSPIMKPTSETPMMRQYREAKRAAGDALLLFRMGDFYELFYDDACKAANLLGLTLTTRDRNKGPDAMPMAGFPHHQLDLYLAKLIAAGCKAAVCEQMEDPKKAKTIVKREVIRVVTPGTVTDESILDPKTSNYVSSKHFCEIAT